ncbi:DUF262 domain-containing HNH endonuclease family protein [Campylobacter ureolyticus]|uniref:DUF262 domain-containing protein n=1 Tax=Campylobacter ureolyticus TaxID=827 RepID=UPI00215B638D|nr:DUF262 domain-containing HNH endonuclease family protein [Campylobacter ureolyticus]MCR8699929.1 DUF262 domain-containing HNH endonuclease family protein [Campylobacter ureolyticus]
MSELIKKYNLDNLAEKNFNFKIPFFQREYSWDEEDVENLINDALGHSLDENDVSNLDDESSYYIGNIVVKEQKDGELMLIDGQQRLMTLYLLAKFTGLKFYKIGYLVDDEDNENLKNIDFKNPNFKMQSLNEICKFIYRQDSDKIEKMLKKIYFTMTTLDENMDEKHYFEAINLNKIQLRKSDILKALFLNKADECESENLAKIWEKCEDMEHYYDDKNPNITGLIEQVSINDILDSTDADEKENQKNSPDNSEVLEVKSIVDFEEFLAIVAKILNEKMPLDPENLIKNFKEYIFNEKELNKNFITELEKYRKLFDEYVFKRDLKNSYLINEKEVSNKPYLMIQLLFEVQSSNEWLVEYLKECETLGDANKHISKLEEIDKERMLGLLFKNKEKTLNQEILDEKFKEILNNGTGTPHYFFYKLDYLLWKNFDNYFKGDRYQIVKERYYLTRLNSIEHIQPQSKTIGDFEDFYDDDKNNDDKKDNDRKKRKIDNFGNLALITSSRNSSLGYLEVNEKKAKIENWIKGKQSIQSLKMLLALEKYPNWNCKNSFEHRKEMIELLKDSLN